MPTSIENVGVVGEKKGRQGVSYVQFGMVRPRVANIAFAHVVASKLFPDSLSFSDLLLGSMVTGSQIERYGRFWRMGRPSIVEDRSYVSGKVGFQRENGSTELWDDEAKDFVEGPLAIGAASAFAIRTSDGRIAFQLRPGNIERQSFAGALEDLLNQSGEYDGWKVIADTTPARFNDFVSAVDRVTKIAVRMNKPNPHYGDRKEVESLIESVGAEVARLQVEGEQLASDRGLLAQAIQHVAAGYGSITAEGMKGDEKVKYDSKKHGIAPQVQVPLEAGLREVTESQTIDMLQTEAGSEDDG
ncbi:MAG: hypothetical protein ACYC1I_04275 [Acidimicrobiales bacterium]|nr:hypothetical protein [Acidimicrobiales bacterium]